MGRKANGRKAGIGQKAPAAGEGDPLNNKDTLRQLEMYRLIFDSIHNGCIVTDGQGYVTHFNKPYGQFLGLDPEAQIGKHCTEVIQNTRMHIVARTRKAEINQTHRIRDQDMVVQRIPIEKDGEVIAAPLGRTYWVDAGGRITDEVRDAFPKYYTVTMENYPVQADYLPRGEPVRCGGS